MHKWFEKVKNTKKLNYYAINVFDYAIKNMKILTENPAVDLEYPTSRSIENNLSENFYNPLELILFEEALNMEVTRTNTLKWKTIFLLLACTGMRKGEALALTWEDMDLENETIQINKTLTRGINNRLLIQPPKTENSKRLVSIKDNHKLINLIKDWKKEVDLQNEITGLTPSVYVFTNSKNSFMDPNYLNPALDRIIDRYDLRRINVHGFRHTHISILFMAGATIKQVQDRVGHDDIKTTMNIYTHLTKESREEAPQLFDDILNKFKS